MPSAAPDLNHLSERHALPARLPRSESVNATETASVETVHISLFFNVFNFQLRFGEVFS